MSLLHLKPYSVFHWNGEKPNTCQRVEDSAYTASSWFLPFRLWENPLFAVHVLLADPRSVKLLSRSHSTFSCLNTSSQMLSQFTLSSPLGIYFLNCHLPARLTWQTYFSMVMTQIPPSLSYYFCITSIICCVYFLHPPIRLSLRRGEIFVWFSFLYSQFLEQSPTCVRLLETFVDKCKEMKHSISFLAYRHRGDKALYALLPSFLIRIIFSATFAAYFLNLIFLGSSITSYHILVTVCNLYLKEQTHSRVVQCYI